VLRDFGGAPVTDLNEVFLSYSRNDGPAAANLRAQVERFGLSVFKDDASIREGEAWLLRLQAAVAGCSSFVVLVGRDGVSRWIGAETQVALIRHLSPHDETNRLPIFPILLGDVQPDSLPAFLQLFQATRWDGAEPLSETLLEEIRSRRLLVNREIVLEGCPYVGLDAFGIEQAQVFFGRQRETLEALACFEIRADGSTIRWVEISGNSGSGKSSLMNAGLLPLIDLGWLWPRTRIAHWPRIGPMMPGERPVEMLAETLARLSSDVFNARDEIADVRGELDKIDHRDKGRRGLSRWLRARKRADTAFLLVIDQFEELFTFANPEERKDFDELLATALEDNDCPLFVISTVRADFLDRFGTDLPRLARVRNRRGKSWLLPVIGAEGLREIIDGPARLAGLDVSEVREAMIGDAQGEPGALPLVENSLHWLWQQREGNRLSGRKYVEHGELAGILSGSADDLLKSLDKKRQKAALELLFNLVRVDPESRQHTRRRLTREDAERSAGGGRQGRELVDLLSGRRNLLGQGAGSLRLITVSEGGTDGEKSGQGHAWVNLIHETLIRSKGLDAAGNPQPYWPTLWSYIEANKNRGPERDRLERLALEWKERRGLGRLTGLAGGRDRKRWKRLSIAGSRDAERFLAWSRWSARTQAALLMVLVAFVGQSFVWTRINDLPLESMLLQQGFRLGYAPLPKLVPIPPGAVEMGEHDPAFVSQYAEKDRMYWGVPGKHVDLPEPFEIGADEVTYDQFDYYVWEQQGAGHADVKYPMTAKGGRGKRPVVNVTWLEAAAYAHWLGRRTGRDCRLPTEAEWEYAARANSQTAYPWGNDVRLSSGGKTETMANCRDCGSRWDGEQSAPVRSFRANAFGLYDTSGNVWEWTCSLWRDQFDGSEQGCADERASERRVVRGGSWDDDLDNARSAARVRANPDDRGDNLGFRVLCASPIPGH